MRKSLIILLAAAVAALWCSAAFAGISGTAHEDVTVSGGPCANCHLPHGAVQGGDRLWPASAYSGTISGIFGEVAPLCAYCHWSTGGKGATYPDANSNLYVYGALSHGVYMDAATAEIPRGYQASGLVYQTDATDGQIECTTCHNVHDDPTGLAGTGYAPFLRANINTLCSGCHDNRRFEGGALPTDGPTALTQAFGAWNGASYFGTHNPGSHPVGTDISGNAFGGASPVTLGGQYAAAFDLSPRGWDLGGHLHRGNAGGVNCISCHAVHGIQGDPEGTFDGTATLVDTTPNPCFLVDYQTANLTDSGGGGLGGGQNRSVANGHNDFNALCEACHTGTRPNQAAYPAAYTSWGTYYQNPGGSAYGHPVDDMSASATWVASFPANWPTGDSAIAGTNVMPVPICESCHVPHPQADQARLDDPNTTFVNSDYILRNTSADVCDNCHTGVSATNNRHHPVGINFDGTDVAYLINVDAGANTLTCATCHGGGAAGGAHNWAGKGALAMDPQWKPTDNGRGANMAADQYNAKMSLTCIECHYGIDGDNTSKSPTLADGLIYNATNEANFQTIGTGTHYVGLMTSSWTSLGARINPQTTTWSATYGGVGAWSRFGGTGAGPTTTVVVCESCHELQPTKNFDNGHLLLGRFIEEQDAQADTRSDFCEGCHLPPGTHPQTGDTVTRHENKAVLDTDIAGETWLDTPADPDVVMVQGQNIINCDNCHQVHDANSNSYTFIIDTMESNVGTPQSPGTAGATYGSYTATKVTEFQQGKGGPHQRFCNECHAYN